MPGSHVPHLPGLRSLAHHGPWAAVPSGMKDGIAPGTTFLEGSVARKAVPSTPVTPTVYYRLARDMCLLASYACLERKLHFFVPSSRFICPSRAWRWARK